jgi:Flp pilus assembly protein TadG
MRNTKTRERGQAMVEVTLMAPWIFFLFIGITDVGFYSYAAICTQNAARAAAVQTAQSVGKQTNPIACAAALNELNLLPNVVGLTSPTGCGALPVIVVRKTLCGASTPNTITCSALPTSPTCADCLQSPKAASSQVAVTYQSRLFVPIPGILTNQLNLTRVVESRIIAE